MCRHTTDSTPELMPFFLSLNYSYVSGKLFNNQARYSSVNGQVLEQTGNEWGKKLYSKGKPGEILVNTTLKNTIQVASLEHNINKYCKPRLKTLAQYCTVLMLASGTHWPNFTIMRKCVNWHMPGFSVSAYIHKISLPFACVLLFDNAYHLHEMLLWFSFTLTWCFLPFSAFSSKYSPPQTAMQTKSLPSQLYLNCFIINPWRKENVVVFL